MPSCVAFGDWIKCVLGAIVEGVFVVVPDQRPQGWVLLQLQRNSVLLLLVTLPVEDSV